MARTLPTVVNPLLAGGDLVTAGSADVGVARERSRLRRIATIGAVLAVPTAWLWLRILTGHAIDVLALRPPHVDPFLLTVVVFFGVMVALTLGMTVGAGRSPHITYRPEQVKVRLADVVGIDAVKEDVVRSLNLFLAHKQFSGQMGGTPRRGLLFEGAPGTGKTHLAKAMAAEAGVPYLFVSATSFQSMFYGATARKIRSYFKALRKAARQEGGAIGFIEEIDAIATARSGLGMATAPDWARNSTAPDWARSSTAPDWARSTGTAASCCGGMTSLPSAFGQPGGSSAAATVTAMTSEGTGGVVNELLVQLQSFDDPTGLQKLRGRFTDALNLLLPVHRQIAKPVPPSTNVLLIAATNRADNLDPALLRPGRFDRRLTFELPAQAARRELVDHFLARKAHDAELDTDELRDTLAGVTQGYTPVMIEHLLDEALVNAVRRGSGTMCWSDVEKARMVEEVGLGQPVGYTAHEKRLIATHEAGHASIAWLVAPERRLEILTIIKRRSALGLLAHGDKADVYTRSKTEMLGLIQIAMGGQVAEELFFGDISTGPAGDLLYATNVAAQMVGAAGMMGKLVSLAAIESGSLTGTNIVGRVLGDGEGRNLVEDLLQQQRAAVVSIMGEHRHLVEALRDALLARDELIGPEIDRVLSEAAEAAGDEVVRPVRIAAPVPTSRPLIDLTDAATGATPV